MIFAVNLALADLAIGVYMLGVTGLLKRAGDDRR